MHLAVTLRQCQPARTVPSQTIVGSRSVPSNWASPWVAPGRIVNSGLAPAAVSASARMTDCWKGTLQSASPWAIEKAGNTDAVAT